MSSNAVISSWPAVAAAWIAAACVAFPHLARAQPYPAKPVRVIVPSGPGPGDLETRGLAQALADQTGQSFVVENRIGAEGILGIDACAKAPKDGYTLCLITITQLTFLPALRTNLPFDWAKDIAPIAHMGFLDSALVVHPSFAGNSVKELFEAARSKPDSVAWSTFGVSSPSHLYVEWLRKARGIAFYNVPYKSAQLAAQAAVAGEVQVALYGAGQAAGFVRGAKLKALAVTSERRLSFLPEVPTLPEAGFDVRLPRNWYGLGGPSGMPREIIQRLNAEAIKAMSQPAFIDKMMISQGITPPPPMTPEQMGEFMRTGFQQFQELMKVIGLKPEAG